MSRDHAHHDRAKATASHHSRATAPDERARYSEASNLVGAASDVLQNHRADMIRDQPAVDVATLWMLLAAAKGEKGGKSISGRDRRALLDAAMNTLGPAIRVYAQDEDQREWVAENIQAQLDTLGRDIAFAEADDRVAGAIVVSHRKVIDPTDESHPREQAEALHEATAKLVETLRLVNEAILGMHEKSLEEEIERLLHDEETYGLRVGSLVELGNALSVIDGYLLLTDDELAKRLHEIHEFMPGVRTVSELVKGVTLVVGGTLGVVTSAVGMIAKCAGEPQIAQVCAGFAQGTGLKIAKVVAWAELINSIATIADWSHSTRQQKMDAAVGGVGAVASIAAKWIPETVGSSVTALTLGYNELKLALNLYWGSAEGIVSGLMAAPLHRLGERGKEIAGLSELVLKAQALVSAEQDPAKREVLERVLGMEARRLGSALDCLLNDLAPADVEAGMANHPGCYKILVDALAPVWAFKGVSSPEAAMIGASVALSCLSWVQAHQAQIVEAAAAHRGLAGVKAPRARKERTDADE